jgi:hypothetical protein
MVLGVDPTGRSPHGKRDSICAITYAARPRVSELADLHGGFGRASVGVFGGWGGGGGQRPRTGRSPFVWHHDAHPNERAPNSEALDWTIFPDYGFRFPEPVEPTRRSPQIPDYITVGTLGIVLGIGSGISNHDLSETRQQAMEDFIEWVGLEPTPGILPAAGIGTSTGETVVAISPNQGAGQAKAQARPRGKAKKPASWQRYEQRHGGKQTSMVVNVNGEMVRVRLDKPPTNARVVDLKDYDWRKAAYSEPFMQEVVAQKFKTQIELYKNIAPNVHYQFSQPPPVWVINAIRQAGGTYSVAP